MEIHRKLQTWCKWCSTSSVGAVLGCGHIRVAHRGQHNGSQFCTVACGSASVCVVLCGLSHVLVWTHHCSQDASCLSSGGTCLHSTSHCPWPLCPLT